jgi:hypothetical protein
MAPRPAAVRARLLLANVSVLLVHQMDAAYWHEWGLFGLPGGVQLYLALNLPIALVLLLAVRADALGTRAALPLAWGVVAAGLFAAAFHGWHLALGDVRFTLPASLALLAATALLSLAQGAALLRAAGLRPRRP